MGQCDGDRSAERLRRRSADVGHINGIDISLIARDLFCMSEDHLSDFIVIVNRAEVDRSPDHVWGRVGGFFDLHLFLDVECRAVSGTGGLGSVRRIGESIIEPMVGASRHAYTYAQTEGPMSAFAYHGTVACEPSGGAVEIAYTLVYDQAGIVADRRDSERARLSRRFAQAVEAMRRVAEA